MILALGSIRWISPTAKKLAGILSVMRCAPAAQSAHRRRVENAHDRIKESRCLVRVVVERGALHSAALDEVREGLFIFADIVIALAQRKIQKHCLIIQQRPSAAPRRLLDLTQRL